MTHLAPCHSYLKKSTYLQPKNYDKYEIVLPYERVVMYEGANIFVPEYIKTLIHDYTRVFLLCKIKKSKSQKFGKSKVR